MSSADLGILWVPVVGGIVMVVVGGLAYAGVGWIRPIVLGGFSLPTLMFGALWLGICSLVFGLGNPILDEPWALVALGVPAVLCGVIGILSILWMPRSLQPQWYRTMPVEVRKAWRP